MNLSTSIGNISIGNTNGDTRNCHRLTPAEFYMQKGLSLQDSIIRPFDDANSAYAETNKTHADPVTADASKLSHPDPVTDLVLNTAASIAPIETPEQLDADHFQQVVTFTADVIAATLQTAGSRFAIGSIALSWDLPEHALGTYINGVGDLMVAITAILDLMAFENAGEGLVIPDEIRHGLANLIAMKEKFVMAMKGALDSYGISLSKEEINALLSQDTAFEVGGMAVYNEPLVKLLMDIHPTLEQADIKGLYADKAKRLEALGDKQKALIEDFYGIRSEDRQALTENAASKILKGVTPLIERIAKEIQSFSEGPSGVGSAINRSIHLKKDIAMARAFLTLLGNHGNGFLQAANQQSQVLLETLDQLEQELSSAFGQATRVNPAEIVTEPKTKPKDDNVANDAKKSKSKTTFAFKVSKPQPLSSSRVNTIGLSSFQTVA